jgi:hypothetical protein
MDEGTRSSAADECDERVRADEYVSTDRQRRDQHEVARKIFDFKRMTVRMGVSSSWIETRTLMTGLM